jgi:hypothetical protein
MALHRGFTLGHYNDGMRAGGNADVFTTTGVIDIDPSTTETVRTFATAPA